jgi:iron complex transport system substrate-binding protein
MTGGQRIISFLPSATEMIYALGLEDRLFGRSHECDFPPAAKTKPIAVKNALPLGTMSLAEIDVAVTARLREGKSLYQVDEELVRAIAPDLIVTQDLCQVCAPSGNEVTGLLKTLAVKPEILWLTPKSIAGVLGNLEDLAKATGTSERAAAIVTQAKARMDAIATRTRKLVKKPRVFCMEWLDPVYCCGHWVPEMVEIAGGEDAIGRKGSDSVRIAWRDVVTWQPEVLVVMPCGFGLEKAVAQTRDFLARLPGREKLPAIRNNRVFAVDANGYFARPGPRIVDGIELLAHLFHPTLFAWNGAPDAFRQVECVAAPALS